VTSLIRLRKNQKKLPKKPEMKNLHRKSRRWKQNLKLKRLLKNKSLNNKKLNLLKRWKNWNRKWEKIKKLLLLKMPRKKKKWLKKKWNLKSSKQKRVSKIENNRGKIKKK
jgi:hypothetical protein